MIVSVIRENGATRIFIRKAVEEIYHVPGEERSSLRTADIEESIDIHDSEIGQVELELQQAVEHCRDACAAREQAFQAAQVELRTAQEALAAFDPAEVAESIATRKIDEWNKAQEKSRSKEDKIAARLLRMQQG